MNELREICIELDRNYYYGRIGAVEASMRKLRQHLADTAKQPSRITGDIVVGSVTGSRA